MAPKVAIFAIFKPSKLEKGNRIRPNFNGVWQHLGSAKNSCKNFGPGVQEGVELENGPHTQKFKPPFLKNWPSDSN